MNQDPAKQAWQASVEIGAALPIEEVRKGADKLYRGVRVRNALEYAACAAIVAFYAPKVFTLDSIVLRVAAGLSVVGALFIAWQLHRRATADRPGVAGTVPIMQFVRAQLVRQRDALGGMLWWYLLPLAPGMILSWLGTVLERQPDGLASWAGALLALSIMLAIFAGVWWLNQLSSRKLQKHIDEIDALIGGD